MKRLSVRVPEDLWRQLKEYCDYHCYTINQIVLAYLWDLVKKQE